MDTQGFRKTDYNYYHDREPPNIFFVLQEAPQSKFPMERRRMIVSGNPTNDQSTTKYKRQLICAQIAAKTVLFHRVKKMGAEAQRQIYVVTYELALAGSHLFEKIAGFRQQVIK